MAATHELFECTLPVLDHDPLTIPLMLFHADFGQEQLTCLFDPGATNDFVSQQCVTKLQLPLQRARQPLTVQVANSTKMQVTHFVILDFLVNQKPFQLVGYVFNHPRYDLVIGQPWIQRYQPRPDWTAYSLSIPEPRTTIHGFLSFSLNQTPNTPTASLQLVEYTDLDNDDWANAQLVFLNITTEAETSTEPFPKDLAQILD
ncbi:hypothetical protein H4R35_006844 [Dimargaris xerosporica]|nr:hypothetical protein H4R35_006844 [Dimargaris xerosporica]